nr:hypothetical protein [Glycomyces salinus]
MRAVLGLQPPGGRLGQTQFEARPAHPQVARQELRSDPALAEREPPAGSQETGQSVEDGLLVGGVVDHVPGPDQVRRAAQDLGKSAVLVEVDHGRLDRETGLVGALARDGDHLGLGVDGDHPRFGEALGQRQRHARGPAPDVGREPVARLGQHSGEPPVAVGVRLGLLPEPHRGLAEVDRGIGVRERVLRHGPKLSSDSADCWRRMCCRLLGIWIVGPLIYGLWREADGDCEART